MIKTDLKRHQRKNIVDAEQSVRNAIASSIHQSLISNLENPMLLQIIRGCLEIKLHRLIDKGVIKKYSTFAEINGPWDVRHNSSVTNVSSGIIKGTMPGDPYVLKISLGRKKFDVMCGLVLAVFNTEVGSGIVLGRTTICPCGPITVVVNVQFHNVPDLSTKSFEVRIS